MDMIKCGVSSYLHNLITDQIFNGWQAEEDFWHWPMRVLDNRCLKPQQLFESTPHIDIYVGDGPGWVTSEF